ncbi:3-oxoacyl-ACP reductase family protein [Bacillus cereus]|uniref:3-oxoacyl-ACP reductase n=1 Tax=Bacillus cereus TaxID=1396 RepID=A0AA44Q6Q8_BACCE|nr:3-oxoacyl-ACP reductase family protein [Bacillus cereus]PFM99763.1 3-oxoacyl-ACP reductase [Bacillus cereus]PFR92621.1 3-oxoacyl-ACP reductase [Bacillus cereus]
MSQIKWDFKGKKALVTGGARGIGRAIVTDLVQAGAKVVFTYSVSYEAAEKLVKELGSEYVIPIKCDFSSPEEIQNLINQLREHDIKKLDFLVNNVGTIKDSFLHKMTFEDWHYVMKVNLNSLFLLTKQLILPLAYTKGSIVNISSIAGITGNAGQSNYAASKAGMIGFTKSLSKELGGLGIRINAVAPGYIETDMIKEISPTKLEQYKEAIPLKRIGDPFELSKTILFLLSDAASYITGQVIVVDGGLT